MRNYKRPSALGAYEPENPRVLWKRRAAYNTPYRVDTNGNKMRDAEGMAQLLARESEDGNRHVCVVAIDANLEKEMDLVWQKRLDLIQNHKNAVYVEDRTLDQELWKLIRVTLYLLAKKQPRNSEVLTEWPSSVLSLWDLVKRNHKRGIRWSVGWPGAEAVTGPDGDKLSPYRHDISVNPKDCLGTGVVGGNEDENDGEAAAQHKDARNFELLGGKSSAIDHGMRVTQGTEKRGCACRDVSPLFCIACTVSEALPVLLRGIDRSRYLLETESWTEQQSSRLENVQELFSVSLGLLCTALSIPNEAPSTNHNISQEEGLSIKSRALGFSRKGDDDGRVVLDQPEVSLKATTTSVPPRKSGRPPKLHQGADDGKVILDRPFMLPKAAMSSVPPRKRGRPPKKRQGTDDGKVLEQPSVPPKVTTTSVPPRKRGRPPKIRQGADDGKVLERPSVSFKVTTTSVPPRKRGRPPSNKTGPPAKKLRRESVDDSNCSSFGGYD